VTHATPPSSAVLCVVAVAGACRRGAKPRERGELTPAEKAVVAAFTSGTISRESPIRVVFQQAVARLEQVGAPLPGSPFRFEPRIKGVTVWAAADRVEFRPAERLPEGQTYGASLDLRRSSRRARRRSRDSTSSSPR
jgi:alpha-2-macroglobulin